MAPGLAGLRQQHVGAGGLWSLAWLPPWPPSSFPVVDSSVRPNRESGQAESMRWKQNGKGDILENILPEQEVSPSGHGHASAAPLPALRRHLGPAVLRGRERGGGRPGERLTGAAGRPAGPLALGGGALSPWGWPAAPLRSEVDSRLCVYRTFPLLYREHTHLRWTWNSWRIAFVKSWHNPFKFHLLHFLLCCVSKRHQETMNSFSNEEFDCHFLDEGFTAKDILDQKINEVSSSDDKDAFYVADLGDILKKHLRWLKALPRVTPFYAVKCNDSRTIVKTLAAIGTGFDCASKTEIQLVQSLGVPPERIIYANPCKQVSQIKYAANNGVQMMTFDSEVELMKVARAHPKAKLVLRIATDDSKAVCRLSVKFGATLKTSRLLLERAKELDIDVIGVSFHVGSGCTDPETFVQAISDARCVFDMGAEVGFNMYLLDIGGGFPGSEDVKLKFEEITSVINPALDKYFPSDSGVRIIAEPGRYYVASAFTLAVNIIAKKLVLKEQTGSDDEEESSERTFMYYVNDGVYGSFNCILYDHAHVKPLLQKRPKPDEKYYSSSIWGPTCDGLDRIVERCNLPEMHVGDWMLFENMGAYTVAAASTFNGFQRPTIYYVMSGPTWQLMQQIRAQDFPPGVEEPDVSPLPVSCARESGMKRHSAACASTRINV